MNYERLTKHHDRPLVMSMWSGDSDSLKVYNRLAKLEDKIESGELVEVPKGAAVLTPEERKHAAKVFAERVKMAFYYEFDELIPSIMADKIDELVEECAK